jgi:hypothetical protein
LSLPTPNEIKEVDEEFWRWIFRENDGPNHPLKISNGGKAQTQFRRILIIAGSLPGEGPKDRSLQIPAGIEFIFVPADNCVYTEADSDGRGQKLIDDADKDMAKGTGNVSVNGNNQPLEPPLPGHSFSPPLDIQQCITGTGKAKNGEGCTKGIPPGRTEAAAACHYAIIRANTLKSGDIIRIAGRKGEGIDGVTYTVQ